MKKEETPKGKTIARSNARELTAEEIAVVSGGMRCVCTCANSSTPCGVDDTSAR
jgi:catalase (peroxidase I)